MTNRTEPDPLVVQNEQKQMRKVVSGYFAVKLWDSIVVGRDVTPMDRVRARFWRDCLTLSLRR